MARRYERSLLAFSGGMSPAVRPELAHNGEVFLVKNLEWTGELSSRKGSTIVTLPDSATVQQAGRFTYRREGDLVEITRDTFQLTVSGACSFRTTVSTIADTAVTVEGLAVAYLASLTTELAGPVVFLNYEGVVLVVRDGVRPLVLYYDDDELIHLMLLDEYAVEAQYFNIYGYDTGTAVWWMTGTPFTAGTEKNVLFNTAGSHTRYIAAPSPVTYLTITAAALNPASVTVAGFSYFDGTGFTNAMVKRLDGSVASVTLAAGESTTIEFSNPIFYDTAWDRDDMPNDEDEVVSAAEYVLAFTTTLGSAVECRLDIVASSEPFSAATAEETPHDGTVYRDRVWLACANVVNVNMVNLIKKWPSGYQEVFEDGGDSITGFASMRGSLIVMKENAVYILSGSGLNDFVKHVAHTHGGTHPVVVNDVLYYLDDKGIVTWDGERVVPVSDHVFDHSLFTVGNTLARMGDKLYCHVRETTGGSAVDGWLTFDPDTFRLAGDHEEAVGEGRVSLYWRTDYFPRVAELGPGWYGISAAGTLSLLETGWNDNGTDYPCEVWTHFITLGSESRSKIIHRMKVGLLAADTYGMRLQSDYGRYDLESLNSASEVTTDIFTRTKPQTPSALYPPYSFHEITLPYQMDGANIRVILTHPGGQEVGLLGIHFEFSRRSF